MYQNHIEDTTKNLGDNMTVLDTADLALYLVAAFAVGVVSTLLWLGL